MRQDGSLRVLGSIEARSGDAEVVAESRPRMLFVLLALEFGRVVRSQRLMEALWGDDAPSSADNALRSYLTHARRMAESLGLTLSHRSAGYVVEGELGYFDRRELARLEATCLRGESRGQLAELRAAAALWRGSSLADLRQFPGGEEIGEELDRKRDAIEKRLLEALVDTGAVDEAMPELETRVRKDPWDLNTHALLAKARYFSGRPTEALEKLRAKIDELRESKGLDFDVLAAMELHILTQDIPIPARVVAEPSLPAELRALAEDHFFGREAALASLLNILQSTLESGRSRVVRLSGESGSGKSQVLAELARQMAARGWRCLYGWCEDGVSQAFAPLMHALQVVNTPRDTPVTGDDAQMELQWTRHERLREALRHRSSSAPLLVMLDDCQWADEPTVTFVHRLDRTPLASPVVLITAERTPLVSPWASNRLVDVQLDRYAAADVDTIAVTYGLQDTWADAVYRATGGLPLLVHDAVGRNTAELTTDAIAARSEQLLLDDRWRTMNDTARDVIRQAATLGAQFAVNDLANCCAVPPDDVNDAVDLAYRRGIVEFGTTLPGWCVFTHSTMRAGVLNSMSPVQRGALHGRVLSTLGGALDELTAWNHATEAWPRISPSELAGYAAAAARRLQDDLSFSDSLSVIERVRAQLGGSFDRLPPTQVARLALAEGIARSTTGEMSRARALLRLAADRAADEGRVGLQSEAEHALSTLGYAFVENQTSLEHMQSQLRELPESAHDTRFSLLHQLADDWVLAGRYAEAEATFDDLERLAAQARDGRRTALLCGVLHLHAHCLGQTAERRRIADRIRNVSRSSHPDFIDSRVSRIEIMEALHDGNPGATTEHARHLMEASIKIGEPRGRWLGAAALVSEPLLDGRLDRANERAVEAYELGQSLEVDGVADAFFGQMFAIQWLRGDMAPLADVSPSEPVSLTLAWTAGLALAQAMLGSHTAAAGLLRGNLTEIPRQGAQWLGLIGVAFAVEAATLLGLPEVGRPARRVLARHGDDHLLLGSGALDLGPAARYLALAEALDGDVASAADRLEQIASDRSSGKVWADRARDQAKHFRGPARSLDRS